ncbi:MAG: SPOR domain-containing protein [Blastomonas sp.]
MSRKPMLNMAVSTIILGAALVSCSGVKGDRPATLSAKAEKALSKGDPEKALASAEAAVAGAPRDAQMRRVLADAYLANGRLLSAEQSYSDAVELGDESPRTVISLALMRAAHGRNASAQALLNQYRNVLPQGDYALAMALSGDSKTGVDLLVQEIREGSNSVKTRQNLALAYALDGRWREAQIMAGQDLDPNTLQARVAEWARVAHPQAQQERVAMVLGVSPIADGGQPAQLALANFPAMEQMVAEVAAQPAAPAELVPAPLRQASAQPGFEAPLIRAEAKPVKTVDLPASQLAPLVQPAVADAPVAAPQPAPVRTAERAMIVNGVRFVSREVVQPLPASYAARPVRLASASNSVEPSVLQKALAPATQPAPRKAAPAMTFAPVANGAFAVQLGIFSTATNANNAWKLYSGKHRDLAAFSKQTGTVNAQGKTLHRLRAEGFKDEATARAMCSKVRAAGGDCIIAKVK